MNDKGSDWRNIKMTSSAKNLAIQYAQAKRQAQANNINDNNNSSSTINSNRNNNNIDPNNVLITTMHHDDDEQQQETANHAIKNATPNSIELRPPSPMSLLLSPERAAAAAPANVMPATSSSLAPISNANNVLTISSTTATDDNNSIENQTKPLIEPLKQQESSNATPTPTTTSVFNKQQVASTTRNNNISQINNKHQKNRPKSTSMTNLLIDHSSNNTNSNGSNNQYHRSQSRNSNLNSTPANKTIMQRPVSRSALDNIHKGMNAKYASVQSKVLLQNIRPQQATSAGAGGASATGSKSRSSTLGGRLTPTTTRAANHHHSSLASSSSNLASSERAQLISKLKQLQETLDQLETERDLLKQESERDKKLRNEQVAQLKQELQDKLAEHERQNEDQHQKLMEAYELADQNRRAADQVLSESRQRDEESRKRIEDLEGQLNELKEFVSMKDEMNGKLYELREQLREERERYEEQLKNLHTVFDNEKIRVQSVVQLESSASCGVIMQHPDQYAMQQQQMQQQQQQHRGNYFNRIRNQFGHSQDSIGADNLHPFDQLNHQQQNVGSPTLHAPSPSGCSKCRSGKSKLHKSEYDLYGSRLSTRMQSTAKSAWRSTKKIASSMVASGVSLTACRHRSASASMRRPKPSRANNNKKSDSADPDEEQHRPEMVENGQLNEQAVHHVTTIHNSDWTRNNHLEAELKSNASINTNNNDRYHTSVIKLESSPNNQQQNLDRSPSQNNRDYAIDQQQHHQQNKLTIVTRYAKTGKQQCLEIDKQKQQASSVVSSASSSMGDEVGVVVEAGSGGSCSGPASASGGERSRCESASSGRGTSEDEQSAGGASPGSVVGHDEPAHLAGSDAGKKELDQEHEHEQEQTTDISNDNKRRHKRANSVFKASQLLPNAASQLKTQLKSLFTNTSNHSSRSITLNHQDLPLPSPSHLECASPTSPTASSQPSPSTHHQSGLHQPETTSAAENQPSPRPTGNKNNYKTESEDPSHDEPLESLEVATKQMNVISLEQQQQQQQAQQQKLAIT